MSIDEEVVHGIPCKEKFIQEGDIVSLDIGVIHKGYHSDAARTHAVGEISKEDEESICGFGRDLKRIYVLMLSKVDGKLIVQPPHWQNEKTTAEFSKFYNYYDGYKYDSKTKKCYKINMPLVTGENNKCPKAADADYRRYRRE